MLCESTCIGAISAPPSDNLQIDGMHSGVGGEAAPRVMVLAATNYPWQIDEALRRWGAPGERRVGGCIIRSAQQGSRSGLTIAGGTCGRATRQAIATATLLALSFPAPTQAAGEADLRWATQL